MCYDLWHFYDQVLVIVSVIVKWTLNSVSLTKCSLQTVPYQYHTTSITKLAHQLEWDHLSSCHEKRRLGIFCAIHFGEMATKTTTQSTCLHTLPILGTQESTISSIWYRITKLNSIRVVYFVNKAKMWNKLLISSPLLAKSPVIKFICFMSSGRVLYSILLYRTETQIVVVMLWGTYGLTFFAII